MAYRRIDRDPYEEEIPRDGDLDALRGVMFAILLSIPFWVVLVAAIVWLVR